MQEREEKLKQQIAHLERINETKKGKRIRNTFFVLSAVVYFIAFVCDGMNSAQDYLLWILAAPVSAGILMFVSSLVMLYVISGAMNDEKYIARLKGELDAIQSIRKDVQK